MTDTNVVAIPVDPDELEKPSADYESRREARQARGMGVVDATEESPAEPFSNRKIPYTVDYLGLNDFYKMDIDGKLKPQVVEVEAYLLEHMAGDNLLFAKAWLDKLASELNFQDYETPMVKFERLYQYIKAKERIEKEAMLKYLIKKQIEKEADQKNVAETARR